MKRLTRYVLFRAIPAFMTVARMLAQEPGSLPDPRLTPGAVLAVGLSDICTPGYTKLVRNVPVSVKREVYARYGIAYVPGEHEVDHLISLSLGGSNSIQNLWPESYSGVWNAHVKDNLELEMNSRVCHGELSLEQAQQEIATNWIAAYQKYGGRVYHTRRQE